MAMDELFKALSIFDQGVKQYQTSQAVNDANEELTALNAQEMDRQAKLEATTQLQNGLSMRLSSIGADPSTIAAATQNMAPSAGAQFQAQESKDLQSSSQKFQADEAAKQRAHAEHLQAMKLDQMGFKDEKKQKAEMAKFATTFRKENKDVLDSREKMKALKGILDLTPDRVGIEMAKTGLLKFAGEDRVSDADVARAQKDPSLRAGIARRLKLEATGEALADDRKFYQMILTHADKKINESLHKKVKGYAEGTAELAGIDSATLESGLKKQLNLADIVDDKQAMANKIKGAEAWLASPKAKENPSKAQEVAKQIARMKAEQAGK